jgi:hypothetical protein
MDSAMAYDPIHKRCASGFPRSVNAALDPNASGFVIEQVLLNSEELSDHRVDLIRYLNWRKVAGAERLTSD